MLIILDEKSQLANPSVGKPKDFSKIADKLTITLTQMYQNRWGDVT